MLCVVCVWCVCVCVCVEIYWRSLFTCTQSQRPQYEECNSGALCSLDYAARWAYWCSLRHDEGSPGAQQQQQTANSPHLCRVCLPLSLYVVASMARTN